MSSQAVIFVPGIKGTKLVNASRVSFDVIWSGIQSEFETIEDIELTGPKDSKYYDEEPTAIIEPGEVEALAYREVVNCLRVRKPTFIFRYDWRLSAVENGARLEEFAEYLVAKSRASAKMATIRAFDFVTHSLGNFVLRNYMNRRGFDRVNKIVFTVPPFRGSLDIVVVVLAGQGLFPGTKEKTRKIIRTCPGALELLPTYQEAGRFTTGADREVCFFRPDHWQRNTTRTSGVPLSKRRLATKFKEALAVAGETANAEVVDLADLDAAERRRILVIARTGYETLQSLKVHRRIPGEPVNYFNLREACRTIDGDGTVPHISSCCYHDSVQTLMVTSDWLYREHRHAFILNDERTQRLIKRFLFDPTFDFRSPGRSIRRVVGLQPVEANGYPSWQAIYQ